VSALPIRRALPVLVAGSTAFLQAHLLLGYAVGPYVRDLLGSPQGLAIAAVVALGLVLAVVWATRRRSAARRAWTEGSCPACLAVTALVQHRSALTSDLTSERKAS
jgi:hypothetical protein